MYQPQIELRWVAGGAPNNPAAFMVSNGVLRLQYRTLIAKSEPGWDSGIEERWTEWQDVPIVLDSLIRGTD